ncbi:MAG: glycoside hydrolase family 2 TIM barrel-domain containing protein [Candidatus Merdivicinus sp.]|jgi:beta-galactosidase
MNPRIDFHRIPDWQTIEVSSVNRVPAHTPWEAYSSAAEAACPQGCSANKVSLNGEWQFKLENSPEAVGNFYREDADLTGFSPIAVPGSWEVQGFGEPIYTNTLYPWNRQKGAAHWIQPSLQKEKLVPNPPYLPKENPTGCYRRTFLLPENFVGKEIFLRFDGVETAYYLWVNGEPVGYAEDSKLPSEFNVTEFVRPGENTVALEVLRFSKSIYLEDQDYWHLSGIHRNVWLIAKPAHRIESYQLTAIPDLCRGSGEVCADIAISRWDGFADCRVRLAIYAPDGTKLAEGDAPVMPTAQYRSDRQPTANTGRVRLTLPKAELWSPEKPHLYRAVITLLDADGTELDWEGCRFGFKKVEVRDGIVYLNGQRFIARGVNRHDFCWRGGRTVSREHMIEEIRQMKRMNINSVRTCHYPDCPEWYDLCDELGILLICECNLETHGVMGALSHNPAWAMQYLERAMRMVITYQNHPSIYSWSLGNESGTGANHAAMYGFIKEYDKTRLCQYEAGEPEKNISDVRGYMYATIERILKMIADPIDSRPIILVEYLYQISNSGGGMEHFRELTEQYPRFQGGYIWDWQDKALVGKTAEGAEYFAYGGDFGESVVDWEHPSYMTNNGIVQADLRWKPVAYEVKEAYCPIWMEKPQNDSAWKTVNPEQDFVLKNRSMTEWGKDFRCEAILRENGLEILRWEVELPNLPPMSEQALTLDIPNCKKEDCEYHLEFSFSRKEDCWFAKAGEQIGCNQFELPGGMLPAVESAVDSKPLFLSETEAEWIVTGANEFTAVFSKETGGLTRLEKGTASYLAGSLRPCLTRPRTGMDTSTGWGWRKVLEQLDGMEPKAEPAVILKGSDRIRLEFDWKMESTAGIPTRGKLCYTVIGEEIRTEFSVQIPSSFPAISRAGLELAIAPGFEKVYSYSRGPLENYADRKLAANLKVWESTVTEQHFPFSPPSETGGHEDARWLELRNAEGNCLRIAADQPFHFDVHHHTIADYEVGHEHELPYRTESYLHIDAAHGPIGSDMAWSTAMPKAHHLKGGFYTLTFSITLL